MNQRILIIPLAVFLMGFSLFGTPKISFDKKEHDFGKIPQHTVVRAVIPFKNKGDGTLRIKDVQSSCGCAGSFVTKKTSKPGQESALEIRFNSGEYRGRIVRYITISTNDPENEKIEFRIVADVKGK